MQLVRVEVFVCLILISSISGCGLQHTTQSEPALTEQATPETAPEPSHSFTPEMIEEYAMIHQMSDLKTAELYLANPEYARKHPYTPTEEDIEFYERPFMEKMYPGFKEYADRVGFKRARQRFMNNTPDGPGNIYIGSRKYATIMQGIADSNGKGASTGEMSPLLEEDAAALHYREGLRLHEQGKFDEAIENMEKAVKLKPDAPGFLYNLGVMYAEKGDYARARQSLQECIVYIKTTAYSNVNLAMYPEIYLGSCTNLGSVYTHMGMYDEAIKVLKDAIQFKPDDLSANWNLAVTYYVMGDMEKAIAQMRRCLELDPGNAQCHNTLGLVYYRQQLYNAALDEFQKASKLAPEEKQYSYNAGLALAELGRYNEANQAFEKASGLETGAEMRQMFTKRTEENKAREMYNEGQAAMKRYEIDRAIDLFAAALKIKPDIVEAHINLGVCYRMRGRKKEEIKHFEEAAKLSPHLPDVHYNLGLAYSDAGMYPQAIAEFDRAVELKPSYRDAHFKLGAVLYRTNKFIDAAAEFERCAELSPEWFEARLNLGSCYIKIRDIDKAIEHFEKAVELNPQSADAHYDLGAAYALAERYGEATAHFQKALDIDPACRRARLMLKQLGAESEK